MSFLLYIVVGFAAGLLGGMGMGGGTILIPALTLLLGVSQHAAQATNVIAFLPMAAIVLPQHKKRGYLKTEGLGFVIVPALIFAVLFGLLSSFLSGEALKKFFGLFLVALGVKEIFALLSRKNN